MSQCKKEKTLDYLIVDPDFVRNPNFDKKEKTVTEMTWVNNVSSIDQDRKDEWPWLLTKNLFRKISSAYYFYLKMLNFALQLCLCVTISIYFVSHLFFSAWKLWKQTLEESTNMRSLSPLIKMLGTKETCLCNVNSIYVYSW